MHSNLMIFHEIKYRDYISDKKAFAGGNHGIMASWHHGIMASWHPDGQYPDALAGLISYNLL